MSDIKLLPCPFCGFKYPEVEAGLNGAKIICPKCGIGTEYIEDE